MSVKHLIVRLIVRIGAFDPDQHNEPDGEVFQRTFENIDSHGIAAFGVIFALILTSPIWIPVLVLHTLWRRLNNR